jgi:hypothetical protein
MPLGNDDLLGLTDVGCGAIERQKYTLRMARRTRGMLFDGVFGGEVEAFGGAGGGGGGFTGASVSSGGGLNHHHGIIVVDQYSNWRLEGAQAALSIGDTVTLTFDYGNLGAVSNQARAGNVKVQLLAIDGVGTETELDAQQFTFTNSEFLGGLDGDFSLSHVVGSNAGERLAFRVAAQGDNHTVIDNLVLDVVAVPEPASLALLGLGGLLMASRRRR